MELETIFTLIIIFALIAGFYAIYGSVKNIHKNHSNRLKHRLIEQIMGVDGARVFYAIIGFGLIVFGLLLLFQIHIKPNLGHEYNNKTDRFVLVMRVTDYGGRGGRGTLITTLQQLEKNIEILGEEKLDTYVQADFTNNYLRQVPDIVWEMKNLEVIDLTYNNISDLEIDKLSKMTQLKTIILTHNPISKEKIEELKVKTKIEFKY